ncbi:TPA: IgG-binding virulence factor TspB family protein, partial [Neisseria meningitidis]
MCCSLSFAEPARIDDRIIKFRPSKSKFFESTGYRKINNEFSKFTEAANVEHIPTGAKARINAKITASVSRAAVLSGVGKLVRQGAKFSTRAVPYVGTALLAHDVYETFKEDIQARGYQYDTETDKFVKGYEYSNCLWYEDERRINRNYGCYGVDSSIMRLMSDYSRFPEVKELMESQMERLARPYWEKLRNRPDMSYFKNYNFKRCYFGLNGGDCLVAKGDDGRTFINFSLQGNSKYKEEMDAKKLEEILSLKVDANPDKYIKATGYPGYSEKVEVAPGTKVNMGPVTDRNGNPVQVVATFGRDSQGNTTVDVQVIPRPDLTPG